MSFSVMRIPGVAGEVLVESSFWRGLRFTVNGERIKPHGFPRNRLTLPGIDGPVEVKIRGAALRAHPSLMAGEREYPTGPPTPRAQQILALLPLLGLLAVQGFVGFLLAFGGVAVNLSIIRDERSDRVKVGLILLTLAVVIVADALLLLVVVVSRA